jgi:uncharacterized protein (TIGR02145 family)
MHSARPVANADIYHCCAHPNDLTALPAWSVFINGVFVSPLFLIRRATACLICGGIIAYAQTPVDLSGAVYDQDYKPRIGVVVSLGPDLSDTTGTDGRWAIQGQIVPVKQPAMRSANLRWLGGNLVTQFDAPTLVSADLFDAVGRRMANFPARLVPAGTQAIPLDLPAASGARWMRVRCGNTSTVLSAQSGVQVPSIALPSSLARSTGIVDKILVYTFQGQIVTEEQLPSLIQSGLLKLIQDYRISAPITLDSRVKIDSVWAWFVGGSMAHPMRARMACDTINKLISGRVYTVKPQDPAAIYSFRTWLNVYGNGNRFTAVSDTIGFTTVFGDVAWTKGFAAGNAFPDGVIVSPDVVEIGNELNLSLRLAYLDTASHHVKDSVINAEWDLADGKGWRASATLPPFATAKWNAVGSYTVKLRVMDKDSNAVEISKIVNVVNSKTKIRLKNAADTTITPSDTVSFELEVRDTSGVAKVIWDFGDGTSDTTKTGIVHAIKHVYPGPLAVPVNLLKRFALGVTVVDGMGDTTRVAGVALVSVINDAPVITNLPDTVSFVDSTMRFSVKASDKGKVVGFEWSVDGVNFKPGRSDTTLKMPGVSTSSFRVYVRAIDEDGSVSRIDTGNVIVYGLLNDTRAGALGSYRTIRIGTQTWMAENLNVSVDSSVCYNNLAANCVKFGRLYQWAAAMDLDAKFNNSGWSGATPRQGVCPSLWHVPSDSEWTILGASLNQDDNMSEVDRQARIRDMNAFSVQLSGRNVPPLGFDLDGSMALYWSSTEYGSVLAWNNLTTGGSPSRSYTSKTNYISVRCLQ